jgi:hypothetical protein
MQDEVADSSRIGLVSFIKRPWGIFSYGIIKLEWHQKG